MGAGVVNINTWAYIVGVYDGSKRYIYVNGIESTSENITGNIIQTSYPFKIGIESTNKFSGSIDEPIILPSALSADQIGAYYNNTKASQSYVSFGSELNVAGGISATSGGVDLTTGLVGEWKLDEKSGTSAADSSGNGNTGTLTNGPVWVGGKNGGAVRLDGVDDYVGVGDF